MALISLSLLLIFSLSSASLSPTAALCSPRSASPYHTLLNNYLPPPSDDIFDSPSPSPSPLTAPSPSPWSSQFVNSPSSAPSRSPLSSPTPKSAHVPSPSSSPAASSPSPSPASNDPHSDPPSGPLDKVVDSVSQAINSVLGGSPLNAICNKLTYPDLCIASIQSAVSADDLKSIDIRSALKHTIDVLIDHARDARDKARALATSDLRDDPLNLCNRTMGSCLSNAKDAMAAFEANDNGALKSNLDTYIHGVDVCLNNPTAVTAEAEKMKRLYRNANDILVTIDPRFKPFMNNQALF